MKILVVAGARPNFMKVAPIFRAIAAAGHEHVFVHTGQHWDDSMSAAFLRDLDIPEPDHHLRVGSATHAVQTANTMIAFEPVLLETRPDWVLVVGDVNSTLACGLVVAKLRSELSTRLAHVEAGLRSRDWTMPEEVNRVLVDRISDLLLLPSEDARANLLAEGIDESRIAFAGNVMIDTLLHVLDRARALPLPFSLGDAPYVVSTLHRPSNVDDPAQLEVILRGLATVAAQRPVVLPLHPRTRERVRSFGLEQALAPLHVTEPLGYVEMLALLDRASVVLTDSGGVQEETTVLGVPCVTLREQTERPVTITEGTNRLAPWPLTSAGIVASWQAAESQGRASAGRHAPAGWDGRAAQRIVRTLEAVSSANGARSAPMVGAA